MSDIAVTARSQESVPVAPSAPSSVGISQTQPELQQECPVALPVDTFEASGEPDAESADLEQMEALRRYALGTSQEEAGFSYQPVEMPSLRDAQRWEAGTAGRSGTEANRVINDTYQHLDGEMSRYLGEPPVANWMTFGKYASREAGEQIRTLENVERLTQDGDLGAGLEAAADMAAVAPGTQAVRLAASTAKEVVGRQDGAGLAVPVVAAGIAAVETGTEVLDTLGTMRDALVKGNTEIYENIAPAYDAFLRGESDGAHGGLQALKDAGYVPGSKKDPQGFVTAAFEKYGQARQRGLEAQQAVDPSERERLLEERKRLVSEGNLQIGLQEQMTILQHPSIFGDAQMRASLEAVAGTMSLTDANGTHALRPDGQSWAGFEARMGLREVSVDAPGAIAVRDHSGRTTHYVPDPSQQGTIVEYFTRNVDGEAARTLIENAPRPIAQ